MNNPYSLSKRELEIARLLVQGKSNKEIAHILGITEHTVEYHLSNIYRKLGVRSRSEAIPKLEKVLGESWGNLGESTVENGSDKQDNTYEANGGLPGYRKIGEYFIRYKLVVIVALLLAAIVFTLFSVPEPWSRYERECEDPDMHTVGQTMIRSYASGAEVHGQFGTENTPPWNPMAGEVHYDNIELPRLDTLYLNLRYSKFSTPTVPILIFLDDEMEPRAVVITIDQHSWDQFTWTGPINLGAVERGVHRIKFFTEGQVYGVADLDKFVLTGSSP